MNPLYRFFLSLLACASAFGADKPNILFIAIDDLVPTLGCYGDTTALTPEIDKVAANGITFLNHSCQWPVCGPSRAALSSGLMPEETGVTGFKPIRAILPDLTTLPEHFRNNGYATAAAGKFHDYRTVGTTEDNFTTVADGQDVDDVASWSIAYQKSDSGIAPKDPDTNQKLAYDDSDLAESNYTDHKILTDGLALIDTLKDGDSPFFLTVGFKKPHLPFVAPKTYWDLYQRSELPLARFTQLPLDATTHTQDGLSNNSELLGYEPYLSGTPLTDADEQRALIHGYYSCVSFVDSLVGQLVTKLEQTDDPVQTGKKLSETTIIVIWSDHGFHLGDHGKWAKHTIMERAASCPLIIYDPRSPGNGQKTTSPANTVDIYPTLCELSALPLPTQPIDTNTSTGRPLSGRSLVSVLQDPESSVNAGSVCVISRNGHYGYSYRTKSFRYIEWIDNSNTVNSRELYDLLSDPNATKNVANVETYQAIVYQLSRSMRAEPFAQGTQRLRLSSPVNLEGNAQQLPYLNGKLLNSGSYQLTWPTAHGVSYTIFSNDDLSDTWTPVVSEWTGSSHDVLTPSNRAFFKVGFSNNSPPQWLSDPSILTDATEATAYSSDLSVLVSDSDSGDSLSFTKLSGPDWLLVASDGTLSGTPTDNDIGPNYCRVRVSDQHGSYADATLTTNTLSQTPSITIYPSSDTFAKESTPDATFHNRENLELRQLDSSGFERVAYLKFTVADVTAINSVKLHLHSIDESDEVRALAVSTNTWNDETLTWNNKPTTTSEIARAQASANSWFTIDLSNHITANGEYSIALDELGNSAGKIDSSESSNPPYLEIN